MSLRTKGRKLNPIQKQIRIAIVGAGKRGQAYASYALKHPDLARVVAVAEPCDNLRQAMADVHHIAAEACFQDDVAIAESFPKDIDMIVIATQDVRHVTSIELLAPTRCALLLEKPLAPTQEACTVIERTLKHYQNKIAVCHVLLYTRLTQCIRDMLQQGKIGDLVSVQHLEPVAWWHQAHSFVRGNWRNTEESAPMLLAKSCHDIDWLRHLINAPCEKIVSFGCLRHFKASEKPAEAADRCWECKVAATCPYDAKALYYDAYGGGAGVDYLNSVITNGVNTKDAVAQALQQGPYGRCVYSCDNDVVDHQTVMMSFGNKVSANFTMTAFTPNMDRQTRFFGTHGYIETDFRYVHHVDFLTQAKTTVDTEVAAGTADAGHGGGDMGLISEFIKAVATNDFSGVYSGLNETIESHRMVFAAEKSRMTGEVVRL